jgi:hypothetical protein
MLGLGIEKGLLGLLKESTIHILKRTLLFIYALGV